MAFWAIKTNFPGPPAWLWPGPAPGGGRGVYSSPRPYLHLTLHFFHKSLLEVNSNPEILSGFLSTRVGGLTNCSLLDFRDIMNISPDILSKNKSLKKLRHDFVDERALIITTLISSCHWETLVPFCLWKKRPEGAFLTLIVNYHEIVPKKKSCHPKQQ